MANINSYTPIPISDMLGDLDKYKYNPSGIVSITLDRLSTMLNNKFEIIDPSNPFTYLLETSCLNTAFSIQEYALLSRKLYPRLANTESDLYHHMSDYDYLGRFAEPAVANITINILYTSFKSNAIIDQVTGDYILKIPRHYKILVNSQIYTMLYPIIIRETSNGILDVRYDNSNPSVVQNLTTDYIEYYLLTQFNNEKYIVFDTTMLELDIEPIEIPIEKAKLFKDIFVFNSTRMFYYLEAFYLVNGIWNKMLVTHTDEVYDLQVPTVILKVLQDTNTVEYYIPPIYVNNNLIGSKVKFLLYTTSGNIHINYNDNNLTDFNFEYNPVFPDIDLDIYSSPFELISKVMFIKGLVTGGKNNLSFVDLKTSVINNSIGDRLLPITEKQLNFLVNQNNFKLVKTIDTITNRVYNLQIDVPKAITIYPISRINLDNIEYANTIANMVNTLNVIQISPYTYMIPKNTIFLEENGKLRLITKTESTALLNLNPQAIVTTLNNNKYLSTMYHYILDVTNDYVDLRAYSIDTPKLININFKNYNSTSDISVNTNTFNITKIDTGYLIEVLANVKSYNPLIDFTNIQPVIVFLSSSGTNVYLEGSLISNINDTPLYHFYLNTNFSIDKNNNLIFTDTKDINGISTIVSSNFVSKLELIYLSDYKPSTYKSNTSDEIINGSYLSINNLIIITQEELLLEFGKELKYLKRDIHISNNVQSYKTYTADQPLVYTTNVYDNNDIIIHHIGDPVLDSNNIPMIKYKMGDVILDSNNNPIVIDSLDKIYYFNFMVVNYKITKVTSTDLVNYINYINTTLIDAVTVKALTVNNTLLENTEAFVTVPKKIDYVNVLSGSLLNRIQAEQKFSLDVYVLNTVYNDINTKNNINYIIITTIDNYLSNNVKISKSQLITMLYKELSSFIVNIAFTYFTELNNEYMELTDLNSNLSINKLLWIDSDGKYNLKEDININYILQN